MSAEDILKQKQERKAAQQKQAAQDAPQSTQAGQPSPAQGAQAPEAVKPLQTAFEQDENYFTGEVQKPTWLLKTIGINGVDASHICRTGIVGMFIGEGGVGKSRLLIELAVATAMRAALQKQILWLGTQGDQNAIEVDEVEHGSKVMLLMGEEDQAEIQRRAQKAFKQLCKRNGIDKDKALQVAKALVPLSLEGSNVAFVMRDKNGNAQLSPAFQSMLTRIQNMRDNDGEPIKWSLIVMDPMSRFSGAEDENNAQQATVFVQACEKLLALNGEGDDVVRPTVFVAHHTKKPDKNDYRPLDMHAARGSSGYVNASRLMLALARTGKCTLRQGTEERKGDWLQLSVVKSNYGAWRDWNIAALKSADGVESHLMTTKEEKEANRENAVEQEVRKQEKDDEGNAVKDEAKAKMEKKKEAERKRQEAEREKAQDRG